MEPTEQISKEWSSLSGVYTAEEADFMSHFLGNCSVPIQQHLYGDFNMGTPSAFWNCHESSVTGNYDISYFPAQGSNSNADSSSNIFHTTSGGNYYSNNQVTNFGCNQGNDSKQTNENTDKEFGLEGDKNLQAHKECEILVSEPEEDKIRGKRSRNSIEIQKNKRNVKSKKNSESACISSYCSDDESNGSQELNGGTSNSSLSPNDSTYLKLSGKSRSNRLPATDPQSVYARRRRERINERLRILQNLVPNGTKVDISTMLEEAVQYVKFLQLQIKLLSSEDLWMFAGVAYSGMNIGL